jgi:hypothetical protein
LVLSAFPEIKQAADVVAALNFINLNATNGVMSFEEAECASAMVNATRQAIETVQLEERIKALEQSRTIDHDPRAPFERPHYPNGSSVDE